MNILSTSANGAATLLADTDDDETPALSAALDYASRGWKVVILHGTRPGGACRCHKGANCAEKSRGKHPIGDEWQKRATTDEVTIRRELRKNPGANIGIQWGEASGVIDVECDDDEAEQTLAALFDFDVPIAPTYVSARGKHRLFRFHPGLPPTTNFKIGKLEFRIGGRGGEESGQQSVMPPSVRHLADGATVEYCWLPGLSPDDVDPPVIPDAVLLKIGNPELDTDDFKAATPTGPVSIDVLRDAVEHLSPKRSDDYQGWINVGAALHHATVGSDDGLELWAEFSQKSEKYRAGECAEKWATFGGNPPDGKRLGVGSLFFWARLDSPGWKPPKRTDKPNEAVDDAHRLAREFQAAHFPGRTLVFWRDEFYAWTGTYWRAAPLSELRGLLQVFVKEKFDGENLALLQRPETWRKGVAPKTRNVTLGVIGNVIDALRGQSLVCGDQEAPCWLTDQPGDPDPADVLPVGNGLLVLPTGELIKPTSRFFNLGAVEFGYDPTASCPVWFEFLDSVWGDDFETIEAAQSWIGHQLTGDTKLQKIAMLIGPPRSGKGVIARRIKRLVGERNYCGPKLADLAGPFGLQALLGKTVAIVTDARLSGRADASSVVENLLAISGGDARDVHRKNLPALTGVRLQVRFMIASNELPILPDASDALTSRLIVLRMQNSFLGREDLELDQKLEAELPGILNWAVEGWRRVRKLKRIDQPASGKELLDEMSDMTSPIKAFLRDECRVGPDCSASTQDLYRAYSKWCLQRGYFSPTDPEFCRALRAAMPRIRHARPRIGGKRVRVYIGVAVRSGTEQEADEVNSDF